MAKIDKKESQQTFLSDEEKTRKLATRYNVPYIDLSSCNLSRELVQSFPVDFLHRSNFIPFEEKDNIVKIAVADPSDIATIDAIESFLGKKVEVYAASKIAINEALRKTETALQVLKDATEGFVMKVVEKEGGDEEEVISVETLSEQDGSIIKLVNSIIFTAVQKRASDVHVESKEAGLIVKYRIDGVLSEAMEQIDKKFQSSIISRIKVMSDLDISERRVPQDGRFRLRIKDKTIDFRISIMPSIHGEDAVIRILDKEMITAAISELRMDLLGFSDEVLNNFRRYITQPYGMVLVTGPTGSGKTTTLYAALTEIRTPEDKIITIEDPAEYRFKDINQIQVNPQAGITFARGLRTILRLDPDVILVGEVRDSETANIAIQAALTGHMMLSSIHASDTTGVLFRLIDLGVERFLIASSMIGVVAQRMVRRICPDCNQLVEAHLVERMAYEKAMGEEKAEFLYGTGCKSCAGTGYK
ncbi:hypothetical protein LCGC14_0607110, partial [marine sediment metagenome]